MYASHRLNMSTPQADLPGGGGISSMINFGGQISSPGIPTKFFRTVLRKPTKFFQRKICPTKNLRRLRRHFLYFLCISFWVLKKPTKFFRAILRKPTKIFLVRNLSLRNLLATKFTPPPGYMGICRGGVSLLRAADSDSRICGQKPESAA